MLTLGIDLGTTKVAAVLYDPDASGAGRAVSTEHHAALPAAPGHAEQDPEDWWGAVCRATRRLLEQTGAAEICGVGIDGQSWSAIPIDKTGAVLCPTPIWMDTRSIDR